MRYLDVCAGISASTVAWASLGWRAAAYSEIEAAPRAVLAHHYPDTPLHGDFTTISGDEYGPIDLLVGGTPCQDFSVAGLRAGLDGDRGNLSLEFLRLADRARPRWVVWENVPGVLSIDGGRSFGAILGGLGQLGYGFAYRVLDAQHFGVPQRRRRVFVVGCAGGWRRAAAVLFERHSLSGHPAPRRQAGQGVTRPIAAGSQRGSGYRNDADTADNLIAFGGNNTAGPIDVATALNSHGGPHGRCDFESETFIAFDTTQITSAANYSRPQPADPCHPLAAGAHPPAICFSAKDHGADAMEDCAPTLRAGGHSASHANAGVMPAIAFNHLMGAKAGSIGAAEDQAPTLGTRLGGGSVAHASAVRRLTPRECERLQGFPDDYTLVPYRRGMMADGPRYKALGNSMAVPVMRWIGERIAAVEALDPAGARKDVSEIRQLVSGARVTA